MYVPETKKKKKSIELSNFHILEENTSLYTELAAGNQNNCFDYIHNLLIIFTTFYNPELFFIETSC